MVDDTTLTYNSISTYVWGVRTWHVMQHQADPAHGVMLWREFMRSVAAMTAVVGEPRRQVPLETVRSMLESLDPTVFEQAQLGLLLNVLLFTFSRTECPCPKTWTGRDQFDATRHWQVKDFRLRVGPGGRYVLWVRFKGIKQDPRIERGTARQAADWVPFAFDECPDGAGHDWVPIGDIEEDPLFSVAKWYKAFVRALGRARSADEPMFLSRDMSRPYTYSCLLSDFKWCLTLIGCLLTLGPHGLRVLGYNLSKRGNGVDLTVAHGGWFSAAHDRYERFSQAAVLAIPAGMLGIDRAATPGVRAIHERRATRGVPGVGVAVDEEELGGGCDASGSDSEADPADDGGSVPVSGAPPGYVSSRREYPSGRTETLWVAPDGSRLRSRPEAWRHYSAHVESLEASYVDYEPPTAASPAAASARSPGAPARLDAVPPEVPRLAAADPGGSLSVDFLAEIVPYHDRPPTRRPLQRATKP